VLVELEQFETKRKGCDKGGENKPLLCLREKMEETQLSRYT